MPSIPEDELSKTVRAILQKPAAKKWNTGQEEYDDLPSYEQMLVQFIRQYALKERLEGRIEALRQVVDNPGRSSYHQELLNEDLKRIKQLKKAVSTSGDTRYISTRARPLGKTIDMVNQFIKLCEEGKRVQLHSRNFVAVDRKTWEEMQKATEPSPTIIVDEARHLKQTPI